MGSGTSGIRVVCAPPMASEAALADEVTRLRASAPLGPLTVLVGGVLLRPYLGRRLAAMGVSTLNTHFQTVGEFGLAVGAPPAAAGWSPLKPPAERQLAGRASVDTPGYFQPVADQPGLVDAVVRLVRELRIEGIAPDAFRRWTEAPGCVESTEKAEALASLYERFDRLANGTYTGATCIAGADPAAFGGIGLLVYGIRQLAAAPRRLIRGIAERGIPVVFFLPTVSPAADKAHAELLAWLVDDCGAQVETPVAPPAAGGTLGALQSHLFAPADAIAPDATETVRVVSAPSQEAEAREAVRACVRWAGQGVAFNEMAVVTKDVTTYRVLLEEALTEAGIPSYSDSGIPLPQVPVGRQIVRLIKLVQMDVPRRELMGFVAEECMPPATLEPYGRMSAWKWDRLSRRAGVLAGIAQWRTNLGASIEEDEARVLAGTAPQWVAGTISDRRALLQFVEDFSNAVGALDVERTLAQHVAAFRAFVGTYVIDGPRYLSELDGLEATSHIVGDAVSFAAFISQVEARVEAATAVDAADTQPGSFMRRGVNLLDASQLPHLRFRAVCVVGLNEGKFPSAPRQDPLLLDGERHALNTAAGWTLPLRAGGHDPGPMQFALLVNGATEFLQLSYARAARPGDRGMLPSAYLCRTLSALTGQRVSADGVRDLRGQPVLTWVSSGRVGPAVRDDALSATEWDRALLQDDVSVGRALLFAREPRLPRGEELLAARKTPDVLTPFDGVLADPAAIALAAGHFAQKASSATRIVKYAKCPRQYFLSSVLNLREEEEPEEILEMQVSTRGTVIHAVLEQFVAANPADEIVMANRDVLVDQMYALVDEHFDKQVRKGMAGRPGLHQRTHDDIGRECIAWLDHMLDTGEFVPGDQFRLEVNFRDLVVPTTSGDIRLNGYIDRLGTHADGTFSVLDYKTGKVLALEDGTIGDGQDLQLPLYMLAGARELGMPVAQGMAAYEFVSRRNGYVRITLTGEQLKAQWGRFEQVMNGIATGVATGDFHHEPGVKAATCHYCDFKLLCGAKREDDALLKARDPHVAAFYREVRGEEDGAS